MMVAAATLAGTVYIFMTIPTGFIPSQDSGYIFAVSMAGQDISYQAMSERQKAVSETMNANPNIQGSLAFSQESNIGYAFSLMKPRDQRKLSVDQTIEQRVPRLRGPASSACMIATPEW